MALPDSVLAATAQALCRLPTAPYHERQIRAEAWQQLQDLAHVTCRLDPYGNVIAHYKHRPHRGQALALVAHLDHPGFVCDETLRRRNAAEFLGGVAKEYFRHQPVLFYHDDSPEPIGRSHILRVNWTGPHKIVFFKEAIPAGAQFGMWSLPAFRLTSKNFVGRACDDLAGVATMIALLKKLSATHAHANVTLLLTRAEEVGFHGALASLKAKPALPRVPILSIETSNARGFAVTGAGPILRVGDRTSVFTPAVTQWLHGAFESLKKTVPTTTYQRLLMSGGTCEATVFQQAGYPTGALCLPLTHYHNMGPNRTIAAESVANSDWLGLLSFLHHLATQADPFRPARTGLQGRLRTLQREALAKL